MPCSASAKVAPVESLPGWSKAQVFFRGVVNNVFNYPTLAECYKVAAFDDVDEAIARANRLEYGFAAYIFTGSLATAARDAITGALQRA